MPFPGRARDYPKRAGEERSASVVTLRAVASPTRLRRATPLATVRVPPALWRRAAAVRASVDCRGAHTAALWRRSGAVGVSTARRNDHISPVWDRAGAVRVPVGRRAPSQPPCAIALPRHHTPPANSPFHGHPIHSLPTVRRHARPPQPGSHALSSPLSHPGIPLPTARKLSEKSKSPKTNPIQPATRSPAVRDPK